MANCNGCLLLCGVVAVICCAAGLEGQSILPPAREHLLPAGASDAVPSPLQHWRSRRSAGAVDVSHTTEAVAADDPCRSAVEHMGSACLHLLQSLPALMDGAAGTSEGNATAFVQAVERLCDDPACMEGLNDAVDACDQVEVGQFARVSWQCTYLSNTHS